MKAENARRVFSLRSQLELSSQDPHRGKKSGQALHGTRRTSLPLLPSGPGGVHAPAHAWHLAGANHVTRWRQRNCYFVIVRSASGRIRPIRGQRHRCNVLLGAFDDVRLIALLLEHLLFRLPTHFLQLRPLLER